MGKQGISSVLSSRCPLAFSISGTPELKDFEAIDLSRRTKTLYGHPALGSLTETTRGDVSYRYWGYPESSEAVHCISRCIGFSQPLKKAAGVRPSIGGRSVRVVCLRAFMQEDSHVEIGEYIETWYTSLGLNLSTTI